MSQSKKQARVIFLEHMLIYTCKSFLLLLSTFLTPANAAIKAGSACKTTEITSTVIWQNFHMYKIWQEVDLG